MPVLRRRGALRRSQERTERELLGDVRGLRALDVGTANGAFVEALRDRGARAIGVDPLREFTPSWRRARSRGSADFALADGYGLPFAGASFDLVTLYGVVQAVDEPERLLAECRRVLRPRGRLFVNVCVGLPWVERFYADGRPLARAARRALRAPTDRDAFLRARFETKRQGKIGFYSPREIVSLVEGAGFAVDDQAAAPSGAFSSFYQACMFVGTCVGREGLRRYAPLPFAPFARSMRGPPTGSAFEFFAVARAV